MAPGVDGEGLKASRVPTLGAMPPAQVHRGMHVCVPSLTTLWRSVRGVCSISDDSVVPATPSSVWLDFDGGGQTQTSEMVDGSNVGPNYSLVCSHSCSTLILPRCSGPARAPGRAFVLLRCFRCGSRAQVYSSLADAVVREAFRAGKTTADVPEVMDVL